MIPLFEDLKKKCEDELPGAMPESYFAKALKYFLNQYEAIQYL